MPPTLNLDDKERVYKVQENEDVTFTVKLSGAPAPTVEWFQSGKLIKKSPKVQPSYDEKSAQLTVRKVADNDVGDYTIRLTNPCGEAEANLKLIIMRKLMATIFELYTSKDHCVFS